MSISGSNVEIDVDLIGAPPGTFNEIKVYVSSGPLGLVSLTGARTGGNSTFDLVISSQSFPLQPGLPFTAVGATSWAGVSFETNELRDAVRLGGWISGDLTGPVSCSQLYRLQVDGDVRASITATKTSSDRADKAIRRLVVGGSIQALDAQSNPVIIEAPNGNIEKVSAGEATPQSGGIYGAVRAPLGGIEEVVANGPIDIAGVDGILAFDGIGAVGASRIKADISSNLRGASGTGTLGRVLTGDGNIEGRIRFSTFSNEFVGGITGVISGPNGGILAEIESNGTLLSTGYDVRIWGQGTGVYEGNTYSIRRIYGRDSFDAAIMANGPIGSIEILGSLAVRSPFDANQIGTITTTRIDSIVVGGTFEGGIHAQGEIGSISLGAFLGDPNAVSAGDTRRIIATEIGSFEAGYTTGPTAMHAPDFGGVHCGNITVHGANECEYLLLDYDAVFRSASGAKVLAFGEGGLTGQYVVESVLSPQGTTLTTVTVVDTPGAGPYVILAPPSLLPEEHELPYYDVPTPAIGSGAVGVVPFRLYDVDCDPPHHDDWDAPQGEPHVLNTEFSHCAGEGGATITPKSVRMRFYGPVRTHDTVVGDEDEPVALWLYVPSGGAFDYWDDLTEFVTITMKRGEDPGYSREIEITGRTDAQGNPVMLLPPGYYAVTAARQDPDWYRVYCDQTLEVNSFPFLPSAPAPNIFPTPPNTTEPTTQYNFRLFLDCDKNGVEDALQTTGGCGNCAVDLDNGDTLGTPDGAVDVNDLIFFLFWFGEGHVIVDLDDGSGNGLPDAAVDINDLLYFLIHFEAGC